jgi:hypothetical protein
VPVNATTKRTIIIQAANNNQISSTPTAVNDNTPPLAATGTAAMKVAYFDLVK